MGGSETHLIPVCRRLRREEGKNQNRLCQGNENDVGKNHPYKAPQSFKIYVNNFEFSYRRGRHFGNAPGCKPRFSLSPRLRLSIAGDFSHPIMPAEEMSKDRACNRGDVLTTMLANREPREILENTKKIEVSLAKRGDSFHTLDVSPLGRKTNRK